MAESVIGSLLDLIMTELAPALKQEVGLICGVNKELDNLSSMLLMIQCFLADADERQNTDGAVKIWLAELKDVAYEADDLLDEFAYEALRQKLMEVDETSKKVCNFFSSCCLLSPIQFRRNVALRIMEINKRVDRILRAGERFHLKKGDGEIRRIPKIEQQPFSSSVIEKNFQSYFVGRDNDIKQIMDLLLSDEDASGGGKHVSVISIVGMGGLGKTTLAQLIYNNESVQQHFQVTAWVCVSEDFDISRLTREIIESATRESFGTSAIDSMQRHLEKILNAKKFLIVLDDVWNMERRAWDRLRPPFSFGAKGSKIVVTTRDEAASRTMDTDHFYRLKLLSDDDCLSLFLQHAFVGENCNADLELMEIGKKLVVSHCQGLPLAAKALGALLLSKRDINFWSSILNSQLWSSEEDEVMKTLRVSYHHLPSDIKLCFAFCSIFPKDHLFEKHKLVKLWMAQGFIQPREGYMLSTLEETGNEYFDFLMSRSFFQVHPVPWSENQFFYKMHDCIHDLAMLASSDECFRFEHGKHPLSTRKCYRHSSFIMDMNTKIEDFRRLYKYKGLRTFILQYDQRIDFDMNQVISDLTMNFRSLRLLVLKNPWISKLPGSISNLRHLRYLDLSGTQIIQLPESVSNLYNLQTLNLSDCRKLCQLPKETRKLVSLRHLNLYEFSPLGSMPPDMGRLTCLQTLPRFIVGRESGCGIGELKGLTLLKGAISIDKLHNISNAKEAEEANLKDKPNIKELQFRWDHDEEDAVNTNVQQDRASLEELGKILEALQPHTNIKCLFITGYRGTNYPTWLQDMMLPNLESLGIRQCTNCNSIPSLGQFHMLKNLLIGCMPNLEEWCEPAEGDFPSLRRLDILYCPKLTKMTNNFSSLKDLTLVDCNEILLRWVPHLTALSTLTIREFKELMSLPEDMLQPLRNLKSLIITGCEKLVSLLEENKGLPPNLSYINIYGCSNIKSLPKGLQSLTSLEELYIGVCPRLLSMPEECLPTSLQGLCIHECPILSERCRKRDGEDWAKISHIPNIVIDWKTIH